ncbi:MULTISPECIES: hypothetical protein [Pseudomonas]|uniref:GGDEF domain-containing protein n=1 Tax=Pseudomonas putida NBRC 14164 TaxID=1211579 RepID=A0ABN5UMD2_PSEPU|nr:MULTISPECIES: hypothetical protein [Pseudomonas]EKT4554708.1 hypothetical protein [Pseudomonas putida]MCX9135110.1 hypothetical protein [Pseudomonas sp. DCB_PUT]MDD1974010.1 hypothetical protein [Pseudomonas putida]MDO1465949.1 hypothetical protein [Pseudomonas putida]MDO1471319.1 hypothetical protein [Pseudomonas putida]
MANFTVLVTVLSMVLGLSITRILLGLITVFRIRRTARPDWVAVVWAFTLFLFQLQFWWALNDLSTIKKEFTFGEFLLLVSLTLALFSAAALILPSRSEDELNGLKVYFEQDGRYALLATCTYLGLGSVINVLFFNVSPFQLWAVLDLVMIAVSLAAFFAQSRRLYAPLTLAYLLLSVFDIAVSLNS